MENKAIKSNYCIRTGPTVFFELDFFPFVFPCDRGWRRADHVTRDDGVVALGKLLW